MSSKILHTEDKIKENNQEEKKNDSRIHTNNTHYTL